MGASHAGGMFLDHNVMQLGVDLVFLTDIWSLKHLAHSRGILETIFTGNMMHTSWVSLT